MSARSEQRGALVRGHSVGCGDRLAVHGGGPHRRDARGKVGGAVPWPEFLVCVEVLLGGNDGVGGLRSAPSIGQRFGEEAQIWAMLEEVTLAQPDRR
jgi:hypothetical protein